MNNCNCNAYPFPHRPGGGKCLYQKVRDYLYDRYDFDLPVSNFEAYEGDFDQIVREIYLDYGLVTTNSYWWREYADMMEL